MRPSVVVAISMVCVCLACHRAPPPSSAPRAAPSPVGQVEMAVTVDDLPVHGPPPADGDRVRMVDRMLSAFQAHAVPRVYGFVNGGSTAAGARMADTPDADTVLRHWTGAGHPVGNHTWTHVNLLKVALPDYLADIEMNESLLERLTTEAGDKLQGQTWKMFRYPFLFEGDTIEKHNAIRANLQQRGYAIAEVTIDGEDWAFNKPFARCTAHGDRQALKQLHEQFVSVHVDELRRMRDMTRRLAGREVRHVLLLHAGVADADAMDDLLTAYEKEGVRWIDLPTALADPFYAQDPAQPARFGAAFPYLVARAQKLAFPPSEMLRSLGQTLEKTCPETPLPKTAAN